MTDDNDYDGFDPTSRSDDPSTSKDAGLSVTPVMKSAMYRLIIEALRVHGPGTMYDIARWSGLRVDQVHKRCPELLWNPDTGTGRLWRPGDTATGLRNRQCLIWHLITKNDYPPPATAPNAAAA